MTFQIAEGGDPARGTPSFTPIRWPRLPRRPEHGAAPNAASLLALGHISDAVLVADMRLRGHPIVHVNAAFEAVTGYPAAEAIGKNCRYLQGSDRLQPEIAEVRAALTEGRECSVTLRNYRRDGTMFRNTLSLMPFRDAGGQVTHFVGIIRNVTHAPGIDRLTGLLDRYGLLDRLAAIDTPASSAVLVVKLDIICFMMSTTGSAMMSATPCFVPWRASRDVVGGRHIADRHEQLRARVRTLRCRWRRQRRRRCHGAAAAAYRRSERTAAFRFAREEAERAILGRKADSSEAKKSAHLGCDQGKSSAPR